MANELKPLPNELYEHYPLMSAQTHEFHVKSYARSNMKSEVSRPAAPVECHPRDTNSVEYHETRNVADKTVEGLEVAWRAPSEMLTAFGADDIREGSRAVLGDGIEEDEWEDYLEVPVHVLEKMLAELVIRSQAEAIIAAKDKRIERLERKERFWLDKNDELEADNAALTARVKELETERDEALRGNRYAQLERMATKRAEVLKTQLAAARKALGEILSCPAIADECHSDPEWGCEETVQAIHKARAALEVKP